MSIKKSIDDFKKIYSFDYVEVLGARTHNLKNIDIFFPHNKLVVITGVSGSGKSSLAFDTINAEGQRRYRESFSSYAQIFLGKLPRPEVDKINGLSPVIAIEQKIINRNIRSTVGTTTEIYTFMRLLFSKISDENIYYNTIDNKIITHQKNENKILEYLLEYFYKKMVTFMAPIIKGRRGHHETLLKYFIKLGFNKVRVNGIIMELTDSLKLDFNKKNNVDLIIDSILIDLKNLDGIKNVLQLSIKYGKGILFIVDSDQKYQYFYTYLIDKNTGLFYYLPDSNFFSFNTSYGACSTCNGLGEVTNIDINTIIPDKSISIKNGAIVPLGPYKESLLFNKIVSILNFFQYKITDSIQEISISVLNLLLFGNMIPYHSVLIADFIEPFEGIIETLIHKEKNLESDSSRKYRFFYVTTICTDCKGTRLNPIASSFKIKNKSITDLVLMKLDTLKKWFIKLPMFLKEKQKIIADDIIKEILKRLQFLIDIGLHYLNLNRSLSTLSVGENKRIRLATQISTQLLGILYILDEPSIGLHQRENKYLIRALKKLRDLGNTVLVVEHEKEIILAADYLIELGPKAGIYGGEVVSEGPLIKFLEKPSLTANFLTQKKLFSTNRKQPNGKILTITGCIGNNLKNITLVIPLGLMICVTGVSGSGKSSLICKTLLPILKKYLYNSHTVPLPYEETIGLNSIKKVIEINKSPIGKNPRSNPSTYTNIFTDIRNIFSILPESKIRGYKSRRFSFNLKEGRCNSCEGSGIQRIEMGFLQEVYILCDSCKGKRYSRETLEVQYKGKSIADILDMTVSNAIIFFENYPSILVKLRTLEQVGLGYITLGQHATTLSGGEAQRVKLAKELSKKITGHTLYILDEPSTGLHFQDILDLLYVLKKLVEQGNTVLIIEHNMDFIKVADYIIDIGPDAGQYGGYIVAQGTPEDITLVKESHTGYYLKKELNM